jgi:hypothetical protein
VQQRLANNRLMNDPQTRAYIARQVFPKSATRSAHQTPFPTTP